MATQLIIPRQLDANGDPASGAKALVYETGTTTPVTVYTDTALSVAHASPIVANSAGYFAQAFYGGSTALKVVVTDSADATLVTYDPVPLVALDGSAAVNVSFSPTTEIPQTNVQAAIVEPIVFDRMAAAALTGVDTKLVTGTAGTTDFTAKWNVDGDLVDGFEVLDEDDLVSDSDTALSTQQAIKAYIDTKIGTTGTFTPVLADASTAGNTATLTAAQGYYESTATRVDFFFAVTCTDKSGLTAGNAMYIRGLPSLVAESGTPAISPHALCSMEVTSGTGPSVLYFSIPIANTFSTFTDDPADVVGTALLVSEFPTTFKIVCHGSYFRDGIV